MEVNSIQNYHKHTCCSNIYTPDSPATYEQYAKRAVELGHKILCSLEHGWQGKYHECREIAIKYGLKFIFGTEAYWVKDRHEKDRTNCHIVLLAKNENGREWINEVLSTANEDGYYYRPRLDEELLFSLPPDDVFVTSACVAFWHYEPEYVEQLVCKLHDYFKDNFMLEIQAHNTDKQKQLNARILELSKKYSIQMIVGLDSHYIYPEQSVERDELLAASGTHYDDEDGWYMDYPDDDTIRQRFAEQGVIPADEVEKAMRNTDLICDFEDYQSEVFETNRKLPSIYPDKTPEEKFKIYNHLISQKFKEYMKHVPPEDYQRYYDGVKMEVYTYKDTGMIDYPLMDYEIVKRGIQYGGIITNTGRGSAVSYFTNTLCGFSKVDRFKSPIKLYPERFLSTTRIIQTNSLPDIDQNIDRQEPFERAQREILGEDHAYPMIAFGTLKKKAAFKLYARAKKLDFNIANKISDQIDKYDMALKYADDDEKDEINIYDFVDREYQDYVKKSEVYWGLISSKSKAPCAYMLYQGSIRRQIGLIKCKSDTTKKEYITTVVDGAVAEKYKFLKNDWLIVDTVALTDAVFKRIGMEPLTVDELSESVKDNQQVWDIYAKGLTCGVNQCERASTTQKLMRYKPKNVSELANFIAAIRPGFKSMYSKFESRKPFSYGIPALDNILQTEEFPYSFILTQEQLMSVLHFAGFPMDRCYGIIKDIAKKHPEKVRPLKSQFIDGMCKNLAGQCPQGRTPEDVSAEIWQIISDATAYSFNASHSCCMAYDSLYNAWQKSTHPFEFYEVCLQHFSNKGKKEKVSALKAEMLRGFNIHEGPIQWGHDNRKFTADKEHHAIDPSLVSIKGLSQGCANDLYAMYQSGKYHDFYTLWKDMSHTRSLNSAKIETLVLLDYFKPFAGGNKILKFIAACDALYERTQFPKDTDSPYIEYIKKCSTTTDKLKTYKDFDYDKALREIWDSLPDEPLTISQQLKAQKEYLGYLQYANPRLATTYHYVLSIDGKYKNKNITLYRLCDGETLTYKIRPRTLDDNHIEPGEIIKVLDTHTEGKWSKDGDQWIQSKTDFNDFLTKYSHVR
jgi:DNA polymerase III alpha subunit